MDRVKAWWAGVERPRRILLGGLLLLFASQFLVSGEGTAHALALMTNTDFYTQRYTYETPMIGWRLHPLAIPALALLAATFLTPLHRRLGGWAWWAAIPVALLSVAPSAPVRHFGGTVALAGVAAVVWAALAARRARRARRGVG